MTIRLGVKDLAIGLVNGDGRFAYTSILLTLRGEHLYLEEDSQDSERMRMTDRLTAALAMRWALGGDWHQDGADPFEVWVAVDMIRQFNAQAVVDNVTRQRVEASCAGVMDSLRGDVDVLVKLIIDRSKLGQICR